MKTAPVAEAGSCSSTAHTAGTAVSSATISTSAPGPGVNSMPP